MESEKKRPDGPEPLPPAEHEEAMKLEEARRLRRESGSDADSTDLPQVHSDDL